MSDEEPQGFADRVVLLVAAALDALGFNGGRLRWKWGQRKQLLGERGMRTEIMLRSARGQHRMCRECRALVPKQSTTCSECGASLAGIDAPGVGRTLSNLLPGAKAATSLILLVNGFLFLLMLLAQIKSGNSGGGGLFIGFDGELLARFGSGISRPRMLSSGEIVGGEWWRMVTPIFLHGGLMHFFFNSFVLFQLGPIVEELYGTPRTWVIYLACGIAGNLLSQLTRFTMTVGASGAIMGLMGLLLVFGWRHGGLLGQNLKNAMLRFGAYMLVFSVLFWQIADHRAHIGGFLCGALLASLLPAREPRGSAASGAWQTLAVAGVLLVLYSFFRVSLPLA